MSGPSEATDKPLNHREPQVFDEIVGTHRSSVYGYLRSRMSSIADAEDLTRQVFSTLYRQSHSFSDEAELRSWLMNAAHAALAEYATAHRKQGVAAWSDLCLEFDEHAPHEVLHADRRRFQECLDRLEPSAREAMEFRYSGQRDLGEVSRRMRRSEDAVKLLIYRARQTLRQFLEHDPQRSK